MRVLAASNLSAFDPHLSETPACLGEGSRPRQAAMHLCGLRDLATDPKCGIERGSRILEYESNSSSQDMVMCLPVNSREVGTRERYLRRVYLTGERDQVGDGKRR